MLSLSMTFETCKKSHAYFQTDECGQYLEECNLCGNMSYCRDHGCQNCSLGKDENVQSLTVLPDSERQILLDVSFAQKNMPPQKRIANKRKGIRSATYYKERYLDDIIAQNERGA